MMNESYDLYKTLGLKPDSGQMDIKNSFRHLSILYHPDKNRHLPLADQDRILKKYEEVALAYNILKNPDTRREYDSMYYVQQRVITDYTSLKNSHRLAMKDQPTVMERPKSVREIHEEIEKTRHAALISGLKHRDITGLGRDYTPSLSLKECRDKREIIPHTSPHGIIPHQVVRYQEVEAVGEMYNEKVESNVGKMVLGVEEEDFVDDNKDVEERCEDYENYRPPAVPVSDKDYSKEFTILK
jgi:hypothetical protein